ncbi:hypothetical protein CH063_01949 [Colletotrichum higginsianum]|uniref:Uncharacterized protein n=1 Tax=Colletotrichum higginsianum (strain IMI 349063) TaxID=759273 RepID=H1VEH5_COLHI|nr:hypothetical protein CH63R_02528 [Colletotrichum higginsianum IMI 349063]OBR13802.1 hypothetical protein CH63R_02528 [Colletotrichum higginsianum IMI 349063]CCF38628.1 hypothetical protein CH063_01949 [Colletotrichum higginsianum]
MIYALAVIDQDVIEPLQVEKRSNKFCGGQTAAKAFSGLLLTCRMFREELQDRPDFYQLRDKKMDTSLRTQVPAIDSNIALSLHIIPVT